MKKKVTIKTLAEELGVSICTVNKALYGKPKVSEETRKRVLELAERLGYTPNYAAQAMGRNAIKIAIVFNGNYSNYSIPIVNSICSELDRLKHMRFEHVLLDTANINNTDCLSNEIVKISKDVKLIVFIAHLKVLDTQIQNTINSISIPIIAVGENFDQVKNVISVVSQDSNLSGSVAADLLYMLLAIDNLIVTTGMLSSFDHLQKTIAFRKRGIELGAKNIHVVENYDSNDLQYQEVKRIIKNERITGIYASTDEVKGICKAIEETTQEIKVIATGNSDFIKQMMKNQTVSFSLDQALEGQGTAVVNIIEEYFKSKKIEKEISVSPIIKTISML